MLESWFAAIALAVCVALLVRLALPWRHRQRIDATARRWAARLRQGRQRRGDAEREAQSAIERARRSAMSDRAAQRPARPPRKLH
jgi:hypothetical protein